MDQRTPQDRDEGPEPDGEWVVARGRPYPERLERGFKIASAVAGGVCACALPLALLVVGHSVPAAQQSSTEQAGLFLSAAVLPAGLLYGVVRTVGIFVVAAVDLRPGGRKHYSLEWREHAPIEGRNWEKVGGLIWAGLLALAILLMERR